MHFTLTAQVVGGLDVVKAARRLLNSDLAVAAAWPSESAIRVTQRLRRLSGSIRRTRAMYEGFTRANSERTWSAGFAFAMRHPRLGFMHLRALWARRVLADLDRLVVKKTIWALTMFILKHPIVGIRRVLPSTWIDRGGNDGREESQNGVAEIPQVQSSGRDGLGDEANGDLMEILNDAERMILDQQVVSAVERASDAQLFGGRAHNEDRFVRLKLRNSYHQIAIPGADVVRRIVFEPRLLIHESGVVQLGLRLSGEGPLNTDQVLQMMWGPEPRIVQSEMPAPVLAGSGWQHLVGEFNDELDAGKPLGRIEHEQPVSMTDALGAHLNAVMSVMRRQYTNWTNYPVAIVEPGDCCPRSRWRQEHGDDVHRLAIRARGVRRIAQHVDVPKDLSMSADHSLFAALGSAVYIQWDGDAPFGIEELDTVLVLEYALLTYMRLESMESDVVTALTEIPQSCSLKFPTPGRFRT